MFDSVVTKCKTFKEVNWVSPEYVELDLGEESLSKVKLLKGALNYLSKQVDLKTNTSKDVYKKSQNIWNSLKDLQLQEAKDSFQNFSLNNENLVYLISDSNEIVDMEDLVTEEDYKDFENKHKQYILELTTINKTKKFFTDGKGGLVKFVCYDKDSDVTQDKYTPIVILELNTEKSVYNVYSGILIYSTFTFIPNEMYLVNCDSLIDFIKIFNMDNYLQFAKEDAERLYEIYTSLTEVEVSARELTSLVKKAGYKLEVDPLSGTLMPIDKFSDEANGMKVTNFYNTFPIYSAIDILNLNEFTKTFKFNELTLNDLLQILSKEYLQYDGSKITVELLADIVNRLRNLSYTDKMQTEQIIDEVK